MKKYENPKIEIVILPKEEIILTSPGMEFGGDNGYEEEDDYANMTQRGNYREETVIHR